MRTQGSTVVRSSATSVIYRVQDVGSVEIRVRSSSGGSWGSIIVSFIWVCPGVSVPRSLPRLGLLLRYTAGAFPLTWGQLRKADGKVHRVMYGPGLHRAAGEVLGCLFFPGHLTIPSWVVSYESLLLWAYLGRRHKTGTVRERVRRAWEAARRASGRGHAAAVL